MGPPGTYALCAVTEHDAMKETYVSGATGRDFSIDSEVGRLLNLMDCRLRRKEIALAEECAEELLEKAMKVLLCRKAARMNKLNRFLVCIMKLLLAIVVVPLVCMVMNIQPLLWLKVFTAGVIMIASLIVFNYYLFRRFYRGMQSMTETYGKESKRFKDLLLYHGHINNNPETTLNMFRLAIMK
jgi:hypothetical protein